MPRSCASLTTSLTGTRVPSAFDICVIATSLVRGVSSFSNSSIRKLPSSSTGAHLITAPWRSLRKCQGTMLEWCSMIERTISSPALMFGSPQDEATRLIASVALRVKMISSVRRALRNFATLARRALIGFGRGIGEIMQSAMHVGVFALVGFRHAVEHSIRLLRGRGVVEIDQRLAIDLQRQRRKILPHARNVVGTVQRLPDAWSCPRLQPALRCRDRELAQIVIGDRFDRLADKSLDQQRLRLPFPDRPRARR